MALTAAASPSNLEPAQSRGQRTGSFVASHDELEQFVGRRQGQLAHAEIVGDEQAAPSPAALTFIARAIQSGFSDLIQQGVSFAVEDAVPLPDDGLAMA